MDKKSNEFDGTVSILAVKRIHILLLLGAFCKTADRKGQRSW